MPVAALVGRLHSVAMTSQRLTSVLTGLALSVVTTPAMAAAILPSAKGTVASNASWPAPPGSGNHFHFGMINAGEMGVEDERGLVEFDLSAQGLWASVMLSFDNAPFQTCCVGVTGGSYTIGVFAYTGNNAVSFGDFDVAGTLIGSFSTAGLTVGTPFSFDVTAAFNLHAGGSLGIRLEALSEPGQTSYTFNNFQLDTSAVAPVPEPATLLLLGAGLAGGVIRRRQRVSRPGSR